MLVAALGGERVLGEVVRPDREEVGLGVTELSMAAPRIPDVKEALRGIDVDEAAAVAREAIAADDARAASALAADLVKSASRATIPPS